MDNLINNEAFGKVLNSHGYGFQYSILKRNDDLLYRGGSRWTIVDDEIPVKVQDGETKIDFVLSLGSNIPIYMIAECKKVNPALSNWCFIKAPNAIRNRSKYEPLLLECIQQNDSGLLFSSSHQGVSQDNHYHIPIELRSNENGEAHDSGHGAIENATAQVCRGLNGYVEFLAKNRQIISGKKKTMLLPVIFTTAKVWVSDIDLSLTNLDNGKVDVNQIKLEKRSWVFYQYKQSPGIKHVQEPSEHSEDIKKLLELEYIRTIAIVTASGTEEFLRWSSFTDDYNP
jgi:hypothetical protein